MKKVIILILVLAATTAWAAVGVFLGGLFQVYSGDGGGCDQPRQNVAELVGKLLLISAAQGAGQFADLLNEPHEGGRQSAAAVPVVVDTLN